MARDQSEVMALFQRFNSPGSVDRYIDEYFCLFSFPKLRGTVTDCQDSPISNSKVTAWKSGWVPITLPPQLGTTYTGDNDGFSFTTYKKASFFTYDGGKLTFSSHPDISESNCDGDS